MDILFIKDTFTAVFRKLLETFTPQGIVGSLVVSAFFMTAEIHNLVGTVWLFIFADLVTGTWASLRKGNGFRSRRFYEGNVAKIFIHTLMIVMLWKFGSFFQDIMPFGPYACAVFMTSSICVYEFSSVVENVLVLFPDMTFLKSINNLMRRITNKRGEILEKALTAEKKPDQPQEAPELVED